MTQKLLWLISAWKFLVCRSESEGCQGNYSKTWKGRKNCESYIFKNIPGINFIFSNWKFFSCFFRLCFFCVFYFPFSFLTIIRTTNLVDTNRKLTVHKTSEDILHFFWASYIRSVYVLCLRGSSRVHITCQNSENIIVF